MRKAISNVAVPSLAYFRFGAIVFVLLISGIALTSIPAWGDNFDFSFTNTVGNVSGTVTGEIFGLTNNGVFESATEVLITGYPVGLDAAVGSSSLIATNWDEQVANIFAEKNQMIIGAEFGAADNSNPGSLGLIIAPGSAIDAFGDGSLCSVSCTEDQGDTVAFTLATVPDFDPFSGPSALALLAGSVWMIRGRRKIPTP